MDKAIQYLERGLLISRQLRDVRTQGSVLTNLANVFAVYGKLKRAIELYEHSIKCRQAIGDIRGVASTSLNLGRAYLQLRDYPRSLNHAKIALQIYEQIHDPAADKAREIVARLRKFTK
jgi:tetratricopeptide (TPR) repeat protein